MADEDRAAQTVVLVPYLGHIHRECELGLRRLEQLGYRVWRSGGNAAIDVARSQLATDALRDGYRWLMWIDSDIGFDPADVERLAGHGRPMVAGIYAKKGRREMACEIAAGVDQLVLGEGGGLVEAAYVGMGFVWSAREVYESIVDRSVLPVCNEQFGRPLVPFFQPMVSADDRGRPWYLAEDYAFCRRARGAGYALWVDTSIRLRHFGDYGYTWEDAGTAKLEYLTYEYEIRRT